MIASRLPFAANFPFASAAAACRLGERVEGGDLGAIEGASITLRFARWPRAWQADASGWLAGPREGGFTREVLSHFVFLSLRLFGPATVHELRLTRPPGVAETALRAQLRHANVTVSVDTAVAGEVPDQNRFEIVGRKARAALAGWSKLEVDGRPADASEVAPGAQDRLAAMLDGRSDHGLASVDEALAVVRLIESMLQPPGSP